MGILSITTLVFLMASCSQGGGPIQQSPKSFIGGLPADLIALDDPQRASNVANDIVDPLVFEGLVAIDSRGSWKGLLAESWTTSGDGLTWTFKVRAGAVFHNRRPVVADDVVFSMNRILTKANGCVLFSPLSGLVDTVVALDPHTVRFTLHRAGGTLLSVLGLGVKAAIIPKESLDDQGNIKAPIGTGPFAFSGWQPGVSWNALAFDGYWGRKSTMKKVTFIPITDETARLQALESGQIQWTAYVPYDKIKALGSAAPLHVELIRQNEILRLNFNSTRSPFSDSRVRQAAAYAVDRQAVSAAIFAGQGVVQNQPFSASSALHLDVPDIYAHPDPTKARTLLTQAGYPNGLTVTAIHPTGLYPGLWDVIAPELQAVGIKVNVQNLGVAELIRRFQGLDYDLAFDEQSNIYNWDRVYSYFTHASSSNWEVGGYDNPQVSRLLTTGVNEVDPAKAKSIYAQILQLLQADAAADFVVSTPLIQVWRSDLHWMEVNPQNGALCWPGGGLNYA